MKVDFEPIIELENGQKISAKQIELLKAIQKTSSITLSAKELNISYKNAWDSLKNIDKTLIESKKNKGTILSQKGLELVKKFDDLSKIKDEFLAKIININYEYIPNIFVKLSARNKFKVKITKIIENIFNCDIVAKLPSNEILQASITKTSLNELDLKLGDEVFFVFKAPKILVYKNKINQTLLPNIIKAKITKASIGSQNSEIYALCDFGEEIVAIIPNETTMDLRLCVNDEIGVIVSPDDIIIAK